MGSTDKAVITGFICRLCSKMNRFVIHIYGEEGERMKLAEKINTYLPIEIKMDDQLPKTACLHCIERLEAHHELMERINDARKRFGIQGDLKDVGEQTPPPQTTTTTTTTATPSSTNTTATSTETFTVDAATDTSSSPPC